MNEIKHTPGPWEVGDLDPAGQRIVRQQHLEICTCWHHSVGSIEREMEANARLIAAAPDMLDALRPFAAYAALRDAVDPGLPDDMPIIAYTSSLGRDAEKARITLGDLRKAVAIIAKAEGRS